MNPLWLFAAVICAAASFMGLLMFAAAAVSREPDEEASLAATSLVPAEWRPSGHLEEDPRAPIGAMSAVRPDVAGDSHRERR